MSFIIGEDVRVVAARGAPLVGLRGKVVLETMHTLLAAKGIQVTRILNKRSAYRAWENKQDRHPY